MELALGRHTTSPRNSSPARFNPCFRGTRPRTSWRAAAEPGTCCFNPCFRGTRPRTSWRAAAEPGTCCFNPCFRGTRPRTKFLSSSIETHSCFNPCFRGTRPRTRDPLPRASHFQVFQSLFSWNSPSGHEIFSSHYAANPEEFQSLFSWNSPSDIDWTELPQAEK